MARVSMLSLAAPFTAAYAIAAPPTDNSVIVGVWKGKMQGLPAITLTVEEEDGKLTGRSVVLSYSPQPEWYTNSLAWNS
jgi:hypothetical protein